MKTIQITAPCMAGGVEYPERDADGAPAPYPVIAVTDGEYDHLIGLGCGVPVAETKPVKPAPDKPGA